MNYYQCEYCGPVFDCHHRREKIIVENSPILKAPKKKDAIQKRKAKVGGLHWTFKKVGDRVLIEHNNESLEIIWQGRNGNQKNVISFVGPRSFTINRI